MNQRMSTMLNKLQAENFNTYNTGETDQRPWGFYEVTNAGTRNGEEFCEKKIGVKPYQALSLQRHHGRRENWKVLSGELTVIHNGEIMTLSEGQSIDIDLMAPHCMINMTAMPVVVYEIQMGVCRESDNDRLCDFSGRETLKIEKDDLMALKSKELYLKVMESLHQAHKECTEIAA